MPNHLMMHVYPRAGGPWRDAINGVRKRYDTFTGRRLFGIATGPGLESPEAVIKEINDPAAEIFIRPNRSDLREVVTLIDFIEALHGEPGRVFYCHTKGATHGVDSICQEWREVMLTTCLDYPQLLDCMLARYKCCGAFKRYEGLGVDWHFSGSFYWANCEDLWGRNFNNIELTWWGVESYPARMFTRSEAGCLFLDRANDLYHSSYWDSTVRPALALWKTRVTSCIK